MKGVCFGERQMVKESTFVPLTFLLHSTAHLSFIVDLRLPVVRSQPPLSSEADTRQFCCSLLDARDGILEARHQASDSCGTGWIGLELVLWARGSWKEWASAVGANLLQRSAAIFTERALERTNVGSSMGRLQVAIATLAVRTHFESQAGGS